MRERRRRDKGFEGEGPFGEVSRRGDDDRAAATFCVYYFTGVGGYYICDGDVLYVYGLIRVLFFPL